MTYHRAGRLALIAFCGMVLAGCNTWSSANVELKTKGTDMETASAPVAAPAAAPAETPKSAADIIFTEKDITDRRYETLADLEVTVNKTTIFHADPTKELVAEKLKEEAAKLNADAVILVRYGTVGVGLFSWGSLDGKGRAIKFVN
ncbi:MAG TPA: hypothetical protein DC046_16505 [Rhodospirillaceae bacterium]|nr:hypothetical protein [Rhodospirillaceae bacterium]|tara:strand:- start:1780 stop:2217 length:438 start_codon:yes stop_codon:yes gene_type:complete